MAHVDLDRGVTMRKHPHGFIVCMYKDEPGVYYDRSERPVDEKIARQAGFPVEDYAKERKRRERLMEAMHAINAEFGKLEEGESVATVGDFSIVYRGDASFGVKDPEGVLLDTNPLSKTAAIKLAREMWKSYTERGDVQDDGEAA